MLKENKMTKFQKLQDKYSQYGIFVTYGRYSQCYIFTPINHSNVISEKKECSFSDL